MVFPKEKWLRRTFYSLFFVLLAIAFLKIVSSFYPLDISCISDPGSPNPMDITNRIDYRIAKILNSMRLIPIFVCFILIILGFLQKGVPRIIASFLILVFLGLLISLSLGGTTRPKTKEATRMSDSRQIGAALMLYCGAEEECKYPGVPGSNQWAVLAQELIDYFPRGLPQDPCHETNPAWFYEYWISPDNTEWLFKANFNVYNTALNDDLDGNIFGAFCGENGPQEREYCASPYFK